MQNKFKKAFTLIELLIVIAIIAILTVAFLPGALKAPAKARDAGRVKAINDIAATLESYAAEHNNTYPANADSKFCLKKTSTDTDTINILASYFPNNEFPQDSTGQGSCDDTATGDTKSFLYRYDATIGYVVAAKMEVKASANSSLTLAILQGNDLSAIKGGVGGVGGDYYVMYGPQ